MAGCQVILTFFLTSTKGLSLYHIFGSISYSLFGSRYITKLVTFEDCVEENIFNLSRVDPTHFRLRILQPTNKAKEPYAVGSKSRYICHFSLQKPAICISIGLCDEDLTDEPKPSGERICKTFTMVPLALEQEREIAVINVIGAEHEYIGQVVENRLSYTTRSEMPGTFLLIIL